ncbi:hypothetical protein [Lacrimispora sp.]|uniref:hypothetical protein n=1 Tax=Lacrimispora sp. TaxID=2719234 RepID=UPI0028AD1CD6|nr:hypothetical protein [Lacrimispora sp.]
MKRYPYPYPWRELPGGIEEKAFLYMRFAEMSVKEKYLVEGASQLVSINTAADLINLTEQLDQFNFYYGATDDASLGEYEARYQANVKDDQLPFLDLGRWGMDLREKSGGVFVSGGFVEQRSPDHMVYDGENLGSLTGFHASVRLKVSSCNCPAGIWIRLPDYEGFTQEPDELKIAMAELGINKWDQALLLEAKCCFGNITEIEDQYNSLEQLISDGGNLGYILEERNQEMICLEERFQAAMELEGCNRLDEALDISQNLHCYDFIPLEKHWEKFGMDLVRKRKIINPDSVMNSYFDYAAYCRNEIMQGGLQQGCHGYISRNDKEFVYQFSKPYNHQQGLFFPI